MRNNKVSPYRTPGEVEDPDADIKARIAEYEDRSKSSSDGGTFWLEPLMQLRRELTKSIRERTLREAGKWCEKCASEITTDHDRSIKVVDRGNLVHRFSGCFIVAAIEGGALVLYESGAYGEKKTRIMFAPHAWNTCQNL